MISDAVVATVATPFHGSSLSVLGQRHECSVNVTRGECRKQDGGYDTSVLCAVGPLACPSGITSSVTARARRPAGPPVSFQYGSATSGRTTNGASGASSSGVEGGQSAS